MSQMKNVTQYFSFGVNHPFAHFHVKITHYSKNECRQEMMDMFGPKWAFQYDEEPIETTELPLYEDSFGFLRLKI